jgi:hypothetical protein
MRGKPSTGLPTLNLRSRFTDNRLTAVLKSDEFKVFSVLGAVALAMTLSVAGILSGLGLFLLSMLAAESLAVIGSSLLFSFSVATFIVCYLWLTG